MNNMMNLPALLTANGMAFGDRAKEAGTMVIMGMVMVFAVLAIIMAILIIMERIFAHKAAGGETQKAEPKPATKAPEAPAPAPVVQAVEDDAAVIAAITVAISAMLAAEGGDSAYQGGFRVVSFKRSNRGTPWNSAR